MNVVNEITRINDLELEQGLTHTAGSWHGKYRDSAWVYAGNLPHALTEGDVLCILSQYGEIEDINLVRDDDTGKSRGFAFVKYEDARSCVLAVDNFTGAQVLGRTLRVDHVERYNLPKHLREKEEQAEKDGTADPSASGVAEAGHAYKDEELASSYNIQSGQDLFARPDPEATAEDDNIDTATGGADNEERRKRKELRALKRKEKEEHRRRKEEKKRKKHKKASGRDR